MIYPASLFEPGMIVQLPSQPAWGLGQVQSRLGNRVTVTFEHEGKQVIDVALVPLVPASEQ